MCSSRKSPDLLLVFPPFWDAGIPYLSVPTLAAYLQSRGLHVESVDLNRQCALEILTPETMDKALRQAESRLQDRTLPSDVRVSFEDNLRLCTRIWEESSSSLLMPFAQESSPPNTVDECVVFVRKLGWAFRIASAPIYPLEMDATGLRPGLGFDRMSTLVEYLETGVAIPGQEYLEAFADEHGRRRLPVLGISVAGPSQVLPAFALAKYFKKVSPTTHVCVGGAHIPYILDSLYFERRPFNWVDTFVAGEGELPLTELCLAVREGTDVARVRGLHHMLRMEQLHYTGTPEILPIDDVPPPDFANFEPQSYLANDGIVGLTFSRGCSWSRCSFCTQYVCFSGYRPMSFSQMASQIKTVTDRYPIHAISLNDEDVTPERLREVASVTQASVRPLRWQALARLAPKLADTKLAQELADSGCRMLCMGLESADKRVLRLNKKGISVDNVPKILETLHEAGIWTHIFLIFGLPGETRDTAITTVKFVHENREFIDSISPTTFRFERHSIISQQPDQFNLQPLPIPSDYCSPQLPYVTDSWLPPSEASVFFHYLVNSLIGSPQCPLEQGNLDGRLILHLLSHSGTAHLRDQMQNRSHYTAVAREILEGDDSHYQGYLKGLVANVSRENAATTYFLLKLPVNGLFVTLSEAGNIFLKLRSLGLSFSLIKQLGNVSPGDETKPIQLAADLDAFVQAFLATRFIQEALLAKDGKSLCVKMNETTLLKKSTLLAKSKIQSSES